MGCEQHGEQSSAIVQAMYLSVVILTFGVLMVNSARHTGNHLDPIDTYLEGWMAADPRLALVRHGWTGWPSSRLLDQSSSGLDHVVVVGVDHLAGEQGDAMLEVVDDKEEGPIGKELPLPLLSSSQAHNSCSGCCSLGPLLVHLDGGLVHRL